MNYDVMAIVLVMLISIYLLTSSLTRINSRYLSEIQSADVKLQLEKALINDYMASNFTNCEVVAFNCIGGDLRVIIVNKPSLVSNSITMFIILDNGTLIRIRL
ncbi:MAG: hypothetical protein J7J99_08955 [Thermoprotei archaeon]|nr:hypothetical protein [Thermoprotei archaeon]